MRNFLPDDVPIKYEPADPSTHRDLGKMSVADNAFHSMTSATFAGLSKLRLAIENEVNQQRNKLCMDSHDEKESLESLQVKLTEEKERLKYINRKLAEKVDSHGRACDEYERARQVCIAARQDGGSLMDVEQVTGRKSFMRNCESMELSTQQNVDIAKQRRNNWEIKAKKQSALVANLKTKVAEAQTKYVKSCSNTDAELADLEAVLDFVKQL